MPAYIFETVLTNKPQMWYRVLVPVCPQCLVVLLLFVLHSHSIQMQERISEMILSSGETVAVDFFFFFFFL